MTEKPLAGIAQILPHGSTTTVRISLLLNLLLFAADGAITENGAPVDIIFFPHSVYTVRFIAGQMGRSRVIV